MLLLVVIFLMEYSVQDFKKKYTTSFLTKFIKQ